ncbi:MAG: DUF1592 domain-containing protein [Planctomycetota bacterium]
MPRLCFLVATLGLAGLNGSLVRAEPAATHGSTRTARGLQALYTFESQGGNGDRRLVPDVAGQKVVIDLAIAGKGSIQRRENSLQFSEDCWAAASQDASDRLTRVLKRSNALSIEAWFKTSDFQQSGPARIVTLSRDTRNRNFTLGQNISKIEVRLRRRGSDSNGLPPISASIAGLSEKWTHVVFSRSSRGDAFLYVNGRQVSSQAMPGSFEPWEVGHTLLIGNELGGSRPWNGDLALVAIFNVALNQQEIQRHYRAGHRASLLGAPAVTPEELASLHFERKIAPLLSNHCLECHDSASREGGLDLSKKSEAFAGGDSGPAIVPGDPLESLVWTSVESDDMPHDRDSLNAAQKTLLKDWIADGAAWSLDFVDPAVYRHLPNSQRWISRLTVEEYIETIRATLGVDIAKQARAQLPPDVRADGFRNTAYNLTVDFGHISAYAALADTVVERMDVVAFAKEHAANLTFTDKNMRPMVESIGKQVLRGPLSKEEVALYRGITTTVALSGGDFEDAVAFVLRAMLQSPRFLYRVEDEKSGYLDAYEQANRLSYSVWGGPPDAALMRAADDGELTTAAGIRRQLDRMWEDPRAVTRSLQFLEQWLDLERLSSLNPERSRFPDWNPSLAEAMRRETIATFRDWVWNERGPLVQLLDLPFTYATPGLAMYYGLTPQGEGLLRYDVSQMSSRGGLLTHGSVLTIGGDDASMVTRGLFVLRDLLFSEVGDPPPGLDTSPVPTARGVTHRVVATQRIEAEACGGCHKRFEPLAFALEKYDGLGRFQERDEHGNSLREDGEILFPGDAEPTRYETSAEMMRLLAESERVAECLTRKVIQFCLARPLDASDARMVTRVHTAAGGIRARYQDIVTQLLLLDSSN